MSIIAPKRSRLEILAFHRVMNGEEQYFIPPMTFSRSSFERLLSSLARSYAITDLPAAAQGLKAGVLHKKSLALTFDDGYIDNYRIAREFLHPMGFAATFFVPFKQIEEGGAYWWDYVHHCAVASAPAFARWLASERNPFSFIRPESFLRLSRENVDQAARALVRQLNSLPHKERAAFLLSLNKDFGPYDGPRLLMNWDEIQELARLGFSIGSHTLSHEPLTDLDDSRAHHEISVSRQCLSDKLEAPVLCFCYPRGAFKPCHAADAESAGYSCAVTTLYGANFPDADCFTLKRRTISDYSDFRARFPEMFLRMEISGMLDGLLRSRRSPIAAS